jgi:EAL domain-containing protein (putative c-di-GMP-specific phosphodiesterase class I)
MRAAVQRHELRVHYQPCLVLGDVADVVGVEALVRWQHPHRGLLEAREFMPAAGDTGLDIPIGRFVLEQALAQLARWRARKPNMTLSVNISARQLRDPALPAVLSEAIAKAELDPAAICLEIAETAVASDRQDVLSALGNLKLTGVRIALDDFGAGASSLSALRDLPIDALKIHESFTRPVGQSPQDSSVVGALVDLGHALGLDVVAEGVESATQLEQLRELGCDAAQGYAIAAPVSEEQLEALLVAKVA